MPVLRKEGGALLQIHSPRSRTDAASQEISSALNGPTGQSTGVSNTPLTGRLSVKVQVLRVAARAADGVTQSVTR